MKNSAANLTAKESTSSTAKSNHGRSSIMTKSSHLSKNASSRDIIKLAKKIGVNEILEEMIQRAQE